MAIDKYTDNEAMTINDQIWFQGMPGIRFAKDVDIAAVLEIEDMSFPDPWPHAYFKSALNDEFIVVEEHGIVIGYLVAVCCYDNIKAVIMKVAVHPLHRGKGVAKRLLKVIIDVLKEKDIQEIELDVDTVKVNAIGLYKKFGFQVMTVVPVDPDEESFCIMKLQLDRE